jgi:hypothetical protein
MIMSRAVVIIAGPRVVVYEAQQVSFHCMNMDRKFRQAVDKKM